MSSPTLEQGGGAQLRDKDRRPEVEEAAAALSSIKALHQTAEVMIEEQNASAQHWAWLAA